MASPDATASAPPILSGASVDEIRETVLGYGNSQPDWAGAFIDNDHGGMLVALFSDRLDEHRAALAALVGINPNLEVRLVRWSLKDLESFRHEVTHQAAWFKTVPAFMTSIGIDTVANKIAVGVSSPREDAGELILHHFGWSRIVEIASDGTGVWLLPRGALSVTFLDGRGRPIAQRRCAAAGDLPGSFDSLRSEPLPFTPLTDASGTCRFASLPATGYWVSLLTRCSAPAAGCRDQTVIAIGRAIVVANSTMRVTIRASN